MNISYLYYLLSYGSLPSIMIVSSLKSKIKKKTKKKKKRKLEEQVDMIVEQEHPPVEEAEAKTTLPEEEIKKITEEEPEKKPSEKLEVPPSKVSYATETQEETEQQGYVKQGEKPAFVEKIKTEHAEELGYTDPASVKAGLPRKGYIESKGLLKDAMLEELKKKHEEATKKEYEERQKKIYGKKEEDKD